MNCTTDKKTTCRIHDNVPLQLKQHKALRPSNLPLHPLHWTLCWWFSANPSAPQQLCYYCFFDAMQETSQRLPTQMQGVGKQTFGWRRSGVLVWFNCFSPLSGNSCLLTKMHRQEAAVGGDSKTLSFSLRGKLIGIQQSHLQVQGGKC